MVTLALPQKGEPLAMDLQGVSLLVEQRISQSHPPMGIYQRELQIHSMGFSDETVLAHNDNNY